MTQLRTIAPTLVDFSLVPGTETRDPERYAALWAGLPQAAGVTWAHTQTGGGGFQRYRSIASDSLRQTLHVAEATLDVSALPSEFDAVRPALINIEVRLFDHGVAITEATFDVDIWRGNNPLDGSALDDLQQMAIAATTQLARHACRSLLAPALDQARRADVRGEVIAAELPEDRRASLGEVMWVSRALILDAARPNDGVIAHWLKDTEFGPDDINDLVTGARTSAVRWLNYIYVVAGTGGTAPAEQWGALRYAQYFYAALDLTDSRLSEVLARAGDTDAGRRLDELNDELTVLSHRAEMIIMLRDDVSKYLTRSMRTDMQEILDGWDYESVVAEPVKFKVDLCERRLRALVSQRAERAAVFTDVILLGIAVTSILGTALTFTEFGRASATDPALAGFDVTRSSVTQWVAAQSADTILLVSGVLSASVVLIFVMFRRGYTR